MFPLLFYLSLSNPGQWQAVPLGGWEVGPSFLQGEKGVLIPLVVQCCDPLGCLKLQPLSKAGLLFDSAPWHIWLDG